MNKQTIIDNEFSSLWCYPEAKIIHHKFHKFISDSEFINILKTGLEYFKKNNCNKWLSDDRNNSSLSTNVITWGSDYWIPELIKNGWKYWAIMVNDSKSGKISMKNLIKEYKGQGINVYLFDDLKKAFEWLMNVDREKIIR